MKKYDAVIVGAGPIGGYISTKLSEEYKVAVIEKNKEIGQHLSCAGLVTSRVFDFLDIDKNACIQNQVKGANIHSPENNILSIGGNKTHGLVIDRRLFDKKIIEKAKKTDADIHLENKVLSAYRNNKIIEIKTSKGLEVKTPLIIGADGPFSKTRDRFINYGPKEYLRGIGAEISNVELNPNYVEIFVGNNIAPGFFAWIIPTDKNGKKARAGLCVSKKNEKSPKYYFDKFLKDRYTSKFLENAKVEEYIAGVIPIGFLKKTYASNVMVVGDAAAQVKPTSGGGIYPGLLSAKQCIKVSKKAINKNDFSQKYLKRYHKNWTKEIGSELSRGMTFRSIYKNLSDNQLDKYIKKFDNPKIIEVINSNGDIDYPSKLVKPLIKKMPFLIKLIPSILKN